MTEERLTSMKEDLIKLGLCPVCERGKIIKASNGRVNIPHPPHPAYAKEIEYDYKCANCGAVPKTLIKTWYHDGSHGEKEIIWH